MKNRIYIFINGILTDPSDVSGWTDRAENWIETNTRFKATKFEYFSGAITRRIWQGERVEKLKTIIDRVSNEDIYLVGHSNGCDIICRYLDQFGSRIEEVHLIAGACERDFKKNGLNRALKVNQVGRIKIYMGKNDKILRFASRVTPWISWLGLGYGYLGYSGAKNIDSLVRNRVSVVKTEYDHSDWFKERNFESTMQFITS